MAKEYTGSEYIEVVDSTIGIKPEKIIEVEPGPGIGIDYPDGKMKISVNLTDEQRLALKGDKGDTGAPGKDGQNGKDGKDGRDGTNGQDGRNGTDGIQGPPGNDGKDGNNGKSVVLTQISNGVNIKLEGDTGDGYNIMNGTNGEQGTPGAPGQGITNIVQQSVTPTVEGGEEQVFTIYVGDASYDVKVLNGMKGDTGAPGQGFKITKTYTTVALMKADAKNIMEGQFVMIASNVEDPDNAQLYVRNSNAFDSSEPFTFIADLSGAQGIKGETGTSVSITTNDNTPLITFTVPAHTDNTGTAVPVQTASITAAAAPEDGRGDGVSLTVGDKSVTIQGGADIEVVDATNGITIKPTNKTSGKDITVSKNDTTHVTTLAVGNKNVTINDGVGVTVEKTSDGITFTGGSGVSSITSKAAAAVSGRGTGVTLTVGSNELTIQGGQNGEKGNDGNGIASITTKTADAGSPGTLTITYTDKDPDDVTVPCGPAGADGKSVSVTSDENIITFTDATEGAASITATSYTPSSSENEGAGVTLSVGSSGNLIIHGGQNAPKTITSNSPGKYGKSGVFIVFYDIPADTPLGTLVLFENKDSSGRKFLDDAGSTVCVVLTMQTSVEGTMSPCGAFDSIKAYSGKDAKIWSLGSIQLIQGDPGDEHGVIDGQNSPSGLSVGDAIVFECQGTTMIAIVSAISSGKMGTEISYEGGCTTNGRDATIKDIGQLYANFSDVSSGTINNPPADIAVGDTVIFKPVETTYGNEHDGIWIAKITSIHTSGGGKVAIFEKALQLESSFKIVDEIPETFVPNVVYVI